MFIYGAGGHAREIYACLSRRQDPWPDVEFVVDAEYFERARYDLLTHRRRVEISTFDPLRPYPRPMIIAVGASVHRSAIDSRINSRLLEFGSVIAHSAIVTRWLDQGDGLYVGEGAYVGPDVHFGRHVHINRAAHVGHDCHLGDFVTVAPGVMLGGGVQVGARTEVYSGAIVLPRVLIGEECVIGAGAVVTRDVPSGTMVVGVPARVRP